jgi:hypothetical protein
VLFLNYAPMLGCAHIEFPVCKLFHLCFFSVFQMYLSQFGYLGSNVRNPGAGNIIDESAMELAIKEFQEFAHLNVTGVFPLKYFMQHNKM